MIVSLLNLILKPQAEAKSNPAKKRQVKPKEYIPSYRSGAYAIIFTLGLHAQ